GSPLARAFARVAEHVEDRGFADLLQALMRDRRRLVRLFAGRGIEGAVATLRRRLGLAQGEHAAGILAQGQAAADGPGLARAAAARAGGSPAERERAGIIRACLADRVAGWDAYLELFFTKEREPRADRNLASQAVDRQAPGTLASLIAERDR